MTMRPGEVRHYDLDRPADALRHQVDLETEDQRCMFHCYVTKDNRIRLVFCGEGSVIMALQDAELFQGAMATAIQWAKDHP